MHPIYQLLPAKLCRVLCAVALPLVCLLVAPICAQRVCRGDETAKAAAASEEFFEKQVRLILVTHCQKCHGAKKQESGLRLDTRDMLMQGGDRGAAIDLQDASKSLLLAAVRHEGDLKMPPEKKLDAQQIADLDRWIREGAVWPGNAKATVLVRSGQITPEERKFWSFQPVGTPAIPDSFGSHESFTPIDRFIGAAWEAKHITPAGLAERRVLFRRATLDLTGLPPEPEATAEFVSDQSPDAFDRVIDRLLATPVYGERWGRHWLDVVRYADTAGETADYPVREAYRYRNYVIAAFNQDKPYDEFLREQIAGDILARQGPREKYAERVTATGYLAISRRFGFDSENYHHLTIQDTIDTVGQSVLGLTLGCARCHDHKFDPVTTEDYYALYGIFESTRYAFPGSEQKQRVRAMAPLLPPQEATEKWRIYDDQVGRLNEQLQQAKQAPISLKLRSLDDCDGDFELQGVSAGGSRGVLVPPWNYVGQPLITNGAQSPFKNIYRGGGVGAFFPADGQEHAVDQGLVPVTAKQGKTLHVSFDFRLAAAEPLAKGSYRFYLGDGAKRSPAVEVFIAADGVYSQSGDGVKSLRAISAATWYQVQFTLDLEGGTWSGTISSPGEATTIEPIKLASGWNGVISHVSFDTRGHVPGQRPAWEVDNFAISGSSFPSLEATLPSPPPAGETADPARILAELHPVLENGPCELAYAVVEGTPHNSRIQKRGEPSKLGDEVPRRFLEILGGQQLPSDTTGSGRWELAEWLTETNNPLTRRVLVNRIWQHHFEQGIVSTENDFGTRGQRPSHPELLDYLADRFLTHGWSIKDLHRKIMLSRVYQLGSESPKNAESSADADPANIWLGHFPRRRLDAESLRDSLLAIGGNLDRSVGGQHPFPPLATWGYTQHNPFTAVYDTNRRSIYLMTQRLKRHPFLSLFDGADTNASTPRRLDTTVPTQSLFLMNDPFVHEQSLGVAQRLLHVNEDARRSLAYEIVLGRTPSADELSADQAFLTNYRELLTAAGVPAQQHDLAAWSALARTLMIRNEFLFVD